MPEFYHDLITEKSFEILKDLRKKFKFILIGGWAVFLYAKALKSKDIDIIIDYDELEKLRKEYNVSKNDRLKKYEIKIEEIDIDISELGLKIEEVKNYCQNREGFIVLIPEVLLILKIYVYRQRKGANKGQKDLIDIFSLLKSGEIEWAKYRELIKKFNVENLNEELENLLSSQRAVPELNLLDHQFSKLKKEVLGEIIF